MMLFLSETITHFRVKEDLWAKKSFVSDIDGERLFRDRVDAIILLDPLGRFRVVLAELFDDVRTYVRKLFLVKKYELNIC